MVLTSLKIPATAKLVFQRVYSESIRFFISFNHCSTKNTFGENTLRIAQTRCVVPGCGTTLQITVQVNFNRCNITNAEGCSVSIEISVPSNESQDRIDGTDTYSLRVSPDNIDVARKLSFYDDCFKHSLFCIFT